MLKRIAFALLVSMLAASQAAAQFYQSDFPPDEFKARWARVFDKIGPQAVAVLQGVSLTNGYIMPRQHNTFYYLCGIETPGAYLLLDGRTRKVTLYLPPRNAALERAEGKVLSADDAAEVQKLTGVDQVLDASKEMNGSWPSSVPGASSASGTPGTAGPPSAPVAANAPGAGAARLAAIYAEFEPAEGQGQSRGELRMANAQIASDPWDGRLPRESRFVELLRIRNPRAEVRNLSPILDELRAIKSPREIALIRRASQLAGLGVMEAMRSTEPGVYEYQLDAAARYIFLVNDAKLEAYRSITAAGTENINNMHYYRNAKRLEDGELVLMDYAPDYRYYVSDIGRVWPVNGVYAPWQRELLQFTLEYHKAVMSRVKPGVTPKQILDDARAAMEPIVAKTKWSKPIYEQAARRLIETSGGAMSHMVGMAVHDVGSYRDGLKPGHVFSVDPQLRVPEEHLYLRFEDTVVVTETGVENFTHFIPMELDDMEKLVREKGLVQKTPAGPSDEALRGAAKR
jgi:Xaa-Pro aminopeptidase